MSMDNDKHQASFVSRSHVHGLLERLAASPSKIAPERVEELKVLVEKHKIEIFINDKGERSFEMGAMFGRIFTPMRVYHHLWSTALYFAASYIERDAAVNAGRCEIDLDAPEMERVLGNYLLSCKCLKDNSAYPLPANAKEITTRSDYIDFADKIFLSMVAFCLLHEIAHLESGDSKTDDETSPLNKIDPIQMEFSADKWAYDWILTHWMRSSTDPKVFIERTFGIIFALVMMEEFRHHSNHEFGSSHPDACDRLMQFFNDYGEQIRANEWGISSFNAMFVGLQAIAVMNDFVLPTSGFSDPVSFLKLAKNEIPRLAAEAKEKKAKYEAMRAQSQNQT